MSENHTPSYGVDEGFSPVSFGGSGHAPSRRRVVAAGAWSVPAVIALSTLPAIAASTPQPEHCPALQPTVTRWLEASAQLSWVPTTKTVGGAKKQVPQALIIRNDGNVPLPAGTIINIRSRVLSDVGLTLTDTPYSTLTSVISEDGKPGLLMTQAQGYTSAWTLICEIPVGYELRVNTGWMLPQDGKLQGQYVASLKISAEPSTFFTVLTPELVTG